MVQKYCMGDMAALKGEEKTLVAILGQIHRMDETILCTYLPQKDVVSCEYSGDSKYSQKDIELLWLCDKSGVTLKIDEANQLFNFNPSDKKRELEKMLLFIKTNI